MDRHVNVSVIVRWMCYNIFVIMEAESARSNLVLCTILMYVIITFHHTRCGVHLIHSTHVTLTYNAMSVNCTIIILMMSYYCSTDIFSYLNIIIYYTPYDVYSFLRYSDLKYRIPFVVTKIKF